MRTAALLFRWSWYSSASSGIGVTSKMTQYPSATSASTPTDGCGSPCKIPRGGHGFFQSAWRPRRSGASGVFGTLTLAYRSSACRESQRPGSRPHEVAAVDHERVAGEVAAGVGAEEVRDRADVGLGIAVAAHRARAHEL